MSRAALVDPYGNPLEPTKPSRPAGNELYLQIPQIELLGDWTTQKAKSLAYAHDLGQFPLSARLYYAMLMDPRVVNGCEKRALALRQLPFMVVPGRGRGASKLAKGAAAHLSKMLPSAVVTENFYQSLLLGQGVGQPDWAYHFGTDGLYYFKLTPWHPQLTYYLNSALMGQTRGSMPGQLYTYVWGTESGRSVAVQVPIITGNGQWFCFSLYSPEKPHLYGKLRAIWRPWIARMLDATGWIRYNDVHGMPIRGVVVPVRYRKTPEGRRFFRSIADIGQDATTYMPQSRDGKTAFDVKLIEAKSRAWETFRLSREEWAREIMIALTDNQDAFDIKGDNYKRAGARNEIRFEVKIADALAWEAAVNEQLMVPFATLNGFEEEAAPRIVYDVRPEETRLAAARSALAEATAIQQVVVARQQLRAEGIDVPLLDLLEQVGISLPPSVTVSDPRRPDQTSAGSLSARAWDLALRDLREPIQVWRFAGGLGSRPEPALLPRAELLRPHRPLGGYAAKRAGMLAAHPAN